MKGHEFEEMLAAGREQFAADHAAFLKKVGELSDVIWRLRAHNAELLAALGLVPELLEAWHTDLAVQAHHRELADCDCAVAYKWRMFSAAIAAVEEGE